MRAARQVGYYMAALTIDKPCMYALFLLNPFLKLRVRCLASVHAPRQPMPEAEQHIASFIVLGVHNSDLIRPALFPLLYPLMHT